MEINIMEMAMSMVHMIGIILLLFANILCGWSWYDAIQKNNKAIFGIIFAAIVSIILCLISLLMVGWQDSLKLWWLYILPLITIARLFIALMFNV